MTATVNIHGAQKAAARGSEAKAWLEIERRYTMKHPIVIASIALLSACAQGPGSVAPAAMTGAHQGTPCGHVAQMMQDERAREADLADQQQAAATGDALGVFLVGLPFSSMAGGDVSGELAESRGRINAFDARADACGLS